jgi:hypothetical protein
MTLMESKGAQNKSKLPQVGDFLQSCLEQATVKTVFAKSCRARTTRATPWLGFPTCNPLLKSMGLVLHFPDSCFISTLADSLRSRT